MWGLKSSCCSTANIYNQKVSQRHQNMECFVSISMWMRFTFCQYTFCFSPKYGRWLNIASYVMQLKQCKQENSALRFDFVYLPKKKQPNFFNNIPCIFDELKNYWLNSMERKSKNENLVCPMWNNIFAKETS